MDKDRKRTERAQGGRVDGTDKEKGCWDRWECSCSWWRSDSSLISKPRYSPPADCVCLREKKERKEEKIIRTNPVCASEWPWAQICLSKSVCSCALAWKQVHVLQENCVCMYMCVRAMPVSPLLSSWMGPLETEPFQKTQSYLESPLGVKCHWSCVGLHPRIFYNTQAPWLNRSLNRLCLKTWRDEIPLEALYRIYSLTHSLFILNELQLVKCEGSKLSKVVLVR